MAMQQQLDINPHVLPSYRDDGKSSFSDKIPP